MSSMRPGIFAALLLCGLSPVIADDPAAPVVSAAELSARIDEHLLAAWNRDEVSPAPECSDETFVRRVYLNLAGRIPTRPERHAYLIDDRLDKKSRLVDDILASEDYVIRFADVFDALLMGRGSESKYQQRTGSGWTAYLRRVFRDNRPWDEVVEEILLARPETHADRGSVWFLYERNNKHQEIAEAVAPAFFGIRIECAQCHDHMVATEIEQAHYWGLVAFFNRGENKKSPNGPRVAESAIGGFSEFAGLDGESHPNLLTFFRAPVVDEARPQGDAKPADDESLYSPAAKKGEPRVPKFSRRERFVSDILNDHPLVARSFVNRMWAILLGRGIVHPFDEMDSVHPPSHPELLDELTRDFEASGFNIARLVKAIAGSRAYSLSSVPPDGVDDPASFGWFLPRAITAEQFSTSVEVAIRGRRQKEGQLVSAVRQKMVDVLPEQEITTIGEALFLANNEALTRYISSSVEDEHLIPQLMQAKDDATRIRQLMLTICGRLPDAEETSALSAYLGAGSLDLKTKLEHVVWSLLTSAEFRFNH